MNPRISRMLWQAAENDGGGFEAVYQRLYSGARANQHPQADFDAFHTMVSGMFHTMGQGFNRVFNEDICRFLSRFDEIYTLNQDTLLEQSYFPQDIRELSGGGFFGAESPGLEPFDSQNWASPGLFKPKQSNFSLKTRFQPYYKLHGSSHWRLPDSSDLMVILGGDKQSIIDRFPLLQHYFAQFEKAIKSPDTRLMIVGYGFADDHINAQLFEAAHAKAKIFVVDPAGTDLVERRGAAYVNRNPIYISKVAELKDAIVGASRRSINDTLRYDRVEMTKLTRFLGQ